LTAVCFCANVVARVEMPIGEVKNIDDFPRRWWGLFAGGFRAEPFRLVDLNDRWSIAFVSSVITPCMHIPR
jgi:hypothetical protein